jgi:F-type H+-transporting ATPase subunit b
MPTPPALPTLFVLAAEGGGQGGGESGNFLVTPSLGLMIWTLLSFLGALLLLRRYAFPRIQDALDRRQRAIEGSIDAAERTRREADELLAEYRERKAAENAEREAHEAGRARREELLEQTRRDIESETRRAIQEIRKEVADMTVLATEKVTRKALTEEDQRRLVEETLRELDFSALAGEGDGRER